MKVCVLSGSPKGQYSITYQTVLYLQNNFPEDTFETIHVGQKIKSLEKDLSGVLQSIANSDLLLFCYPVYTFMAPYQLHKFIELLKASGENFVGKFAAQITTSKHFYDTTAQKYVEENCLDAGLAYLGGLPADMEDLLTEKGQKEAIAFWKLIKFRMENGLAEYPVAKKPSPETHYTPTFSPVSKRAGKSVVVVANLKIGDNDLKAMIEDFENLCPYETKVVNLNEYPFKGGCLGCFGCATTGKCIYNDGFDEFLRKEIQSASSIIYAFRIEDHSMGSRMKLFDDRQFCNGHRTVTAGSPTGYLIQGDLNSEENLKTVIIGRSQVGGNFLAGMATDSTGVKNLVATLEYALENNLTQPSDFSGVGGMKIFRDLIYLMRGMMKADHKFYKENGLYDDFPQKHKGTAFKMKLVGALISNPKIKAKMGNKMNEGMLAPYKKILKSPANKE